MTILVSRTDLRSVGHLAKLTNVKRNEQRLAK